MLKGRGRILVLAVPLVGIAAQGCGAVGDGSADSAMEWTAVSMLVMRRGLCQVSQFIR